MENKERLELLKSYARKVYTLTDHLKKFPREMWDYKPDDSCWSIREILWHTLDNEIHAYLRFRLVSMKIGAPIPVIDGKLWSEGIDYAYQDPDEAVEGLAWVLKANSKFLRSRAPEDFSKTLEDLVQHQDRHIQHHMDQMTKRFAEWTGAKK
jgi:uncharacterized damage-inducible protein DinB